MPDPTPTPAPAPAPAKPKIHRSSSNLLFLHEIKDSRKVAKSALDARYNPGLVEVEMDPTLPTQITTLANNIQTTLGKITGARTGGKAMTKQETLARGALLGVLAPIQSAAKRKFTDDEDTLRENYGIAAGLGSQSLEAVTTFCSGVLDRLSPGPGNTPPLDVLLGIKTAQISALSDAIATYGAKDDAQSDQQELAAALLEAVKTDIATLARLRRQVQLAADQSWPWRTKGVKSIRKAFLLPPDRPLTD